MRYAGTRLRKWHLFSYLILLAVMTMTQSRPLALAQGSIGLEDIVNPLIPQRADPWIYRHTDGYYYFTASVPAYDRIELRRAPTIAGLATAEPVDIWHKRDYGFMSMHIWAPEIHFIDGKWYIYFAAARTDAPFDHRMYVLENAAENPLEGTWEEKGQIKTEWESFSLDATTFEHNGTRYLVWAQRDFRVRGNSNLYIAAMSNPWTIIEPQVELTRPTYGWERIGFWVNEGPAVLKRNGRIFITYSGSATDSNYAMGLLTADEDSDLLDPDSWTKAREPVFFTNATTGQYGPGHNSFTVSPEGDDLLVYHARNYEEIEGDPLYDPNRHARVQKLYWNADGTPNFGIPLPDGPLPVRFRVASEDGAYLAHDGKQAILSDGETPVQRTLFRVMPGLADESASSLEAADRPGSYLRVREGQVMLETDDDSETFAAGATWRITAAPGGEGVQLESYGAPGAWLVARDGTLAVEALSEADASAGTFVLER